jgi:hypothetical protein
MITAKRCLAVILFLAVAGGAESLTAQRALGGGGLGLMGLGPRLGENVDMALQHQDQLGLSAEQVAALQEIRAGIQRDVEPLQGLMDNLRGGILRGEVARPQGWNQLQELWAEYDVAAGPYRTGVASVLSATQHQALQQLMFATRVPAGWGGGWAPGTAPGAEWDIGPTVPWTGALGAGRGAGRGFGRAAGWGVGRGARWGAGWGAGWAPGRGFARGGARVPVQRPLRRGW